MAGPPIPRLDQATLSPVESFDVALVDRLTPWLRTRTARLLGTIGKVGDKPPLLGLSGLVLAAGLVRGDRRLARTGGRMALAHLLSVAAVQFGKNRVDRSRPRLLMARRRYLFRRGTSRDASLRAFPSGHTAGATALAGAIGTVPAHVAAAATGAFQVPRRAHWPSDVIVGVAIGLLAAGLATRVIPDRSRA